MSTARPRKVWPSTPKFTSSIYYVWVEMRQRCQNPNSSNYKNYGGRGIAVCERWQSFDNFFADMGAAPPRKSLDRIDNHGPYSKENCRWATRAEQGRNRRDNRLFELDGKKLTAAEISQNLGLAPGALHNRLKHGWDVKSAITTPNLAANGPPIHLPCQVGARFGRVVVLAEGSQVAKPNASGMRRTWRVRCDCGREKEIGMSALRSGTTLSCGCLRREQSPETKQKRVESNRLTREKRNAAIREIS